MACSSGRVDGSNHLVKPRSLCSKSKLGGERRDGTAAVLPRDIPVDRHFTCEKGTPPVCPLRPRDWTGDVSAPGLNRLGMF